MGRAGMMWVGWETGGGVLRVVGGVGGVGVVAGARACWREGVLVGVGCDGPVVGGA